jgi:hypothetical protein
MIAWLFSPRSSPLTPMQQAPDGVAKGASAPEPPAQSGARMAVPVRLTIKLKPPLSMR